MLAVLLILVAAVDTGLGLDEDTGTGISQLRTGLWCKRYAALTDHDLFWYTDIHIFIAAGFLQERNNSPGITRKT